MILRCWQRPKAEIKASCDGELPNVLDPFCGGGTIPLEAQRLGLPAYGGDLNPVPVLLSRALVEIPPRFAGLPPVNPDARDRFGSESWERAQGLAEDIGYYGRWMRDRAFERIGHLYPKVTLPTSEGGGEATAIAWICARTVRSPDPSWNGHVPLVRSWILRKAKRNKPVVWVEPVIDRPDRKVDYRIRHGGKPIAGTIEPNGATCVATRTPMSFDYIADQGRRGLIDRTLIAIVAKGNRQRVYLQPAEELRPPELGWSPRIPLPKRTLGFRVQRYGLVEWADLFTKRQLVALSTFSDLLSEVRSLVENHARTAGLSRDGVQLQDGGSGTLAYTDAVTTYLAFGIDRCASLWTNLTRWNSTGEKLQHLFGRSALSMVWDFAEANPFSNLSGNWSGQMDWIQKAVAAVPSQGLGEVKQQDAAARVAEFSSPLVSTDPPYYDNVPYADLSDFFYVWLRRNLSGVWPKETATMLTPKADELVANPDRAGSKRAADAHFENRMAVVLDQIAHSQHEKFPATIFYAFKQQELKKEGLLSTGWETFLQGMADAGLQVIATWPVRTVMPNRLRAIGAAALATSVVIACRPRRTDAPLATRREFLDTLQTELPKAVRLLQDQAIAPVDMAQSAIGPGMEIFSRYAKVLEADGSPMRVRTALALINEALEEALSAEETEFDGDTRWALTWYEQFGHDLAPFGDAETLSKAKNTSVAGRRPSGHRRVDGGQGASDHAGRTRRGVGPDCGQAANCVGGGSADDRSAGSWGGRGGRSIAEGGRRHG